MNTHTHTLASPSSLLVLFSHSALVDTAALHDDIRPPGPNVSFRAYPHWKSQVEVTFERVGTPPFTGSEHPLLRIHMVCKTQRSSLFFNPYAVLHLMPRGRRSFKVFQHRVGDDMCPHIATCTMTCYTAEVTLQQKSTSREHAQKKNSNRRDRPEPTTNTFDHHRAPPSPTQSIPNRFN